MTAPKTLEEVAHTAYLQGILDTSSLSWLLYGDGKAQIEALYIPKESVVRAIGQDNYITKPSGNSRLDQQVQSEIDGENKLRHRIRKALKLDDKP